MRHRQDRLASLRDDPDDAQGAVEAEYLEGRCVELAAMAEKANFKGLARILGVAVTEAYLVGQRHRARVSDDDTSSPKP